MYELMFYSIVTIFFVTLILDLKHPISFSSAGYDLVRSVPGAGGSNNRSALTRLINNAINEHLGIARGQRSQTTADQNEEVFSKMDEIGDQVRDMVKQSIRQDHG